jgi:para-aminobenzoate synthetase component 1
VIATPTKPHAAAAVARQLGRRPGPAWLVSPGAGELEPHAAFVASDPIAVVRGDSLPALEAAWAEARARWAAGPGVPVGIGFFSYDLGRQFVPVRGPAPPPSGWPALEFRFYDAFFVRRAEEAEIWAADAAAAARLLARIGDADTAPGSFRMSAFSPAEPPADHLRAVARVREYLHAGDAYQVNLARRLHAHVVQEGPAGLELFVRLLADAPAPHALWFAAPEAGWALIGNSPERFLRLATDGVIETAPIKGTRPRAATGAGDVAALAELTASPKDRAEHVMIVDLERNDLGRVCETGSVAVVDPLRGMVLPSVLHLVSTVRGRLRAGTPLTEVLRATFPGGSITGAPKRRAMEIIDELEPAQRGPYTGATGWLGAAGDFDLAVAIRTALLRAGRLTLWVGGGVVADSSPEAELEETEVKARAFAALAAREVV